MKGLYWIVAAVSLGGLLFGFDTGVISGCEEAVKREFALAPFWHALVVAGAFFAAMMLFEAVWAVFFMPETKGRSITGGED